MKIKIVIIMIMETSAPLMMHKRNAPIIACARESMTNIAMDSVFSFVKKDMTMMMVIIMETAFSIRKVRYNFHSTF